MLTRSQTKRSQEKHPTTGGKRLPELRELSNSPSLSPSLSRSLSPSLSRSTQHNLSHTSHTSHTPQSTVELDVGSVSQSIVPNPPDALHASLDGSVLSSTSGAKVVELRRELHHWYQDLSKAKHHLEFLKQCQQDKVVPTGLRITTEAHVIHPYYTDIHQVFNVLIREAEDTFIAAIIKHYEFLIPILENNIAELHEDMQPLVDGMSPAQEEEHTTIITKTKENIERKESVLQEKAKKKIKKLKHPDSKKGPRPRRHPPSHLHQHPRLPHHATKQSPKAQPQPTPTNTNLPTLPQQRRQRLPLLPTPQPTSFPPQGLPPPALHYHTQAQGPHLPSQHYHAQPHQLQGLPPPSQHSPTWTQRPPPPLRHYPIRTFQGLPPPAQHYHAQGQGLPPPPLPPPPPLQPFTSKQDIISNIMHLIFSL